MPTAGLAETHIEGHPSGAVRYVGRIYRPPSEADAYILQATIGCSWNHCTYCDMYRDKSFAIRPLEETLEDIDAAAAEVGDRVEKVFVADGDALILPMDHWQPIPERCRARFPRLRRVSCYAMARNVAGKTDAELRTLAEAGLKTLYIGPESGDDVTLKRIAKGDTFAGHVEAAQRAKSAGMKLSVIALLGIASERSEAHAEATARLVTEMDPAYFAALTVTVVPGTPLATLRSRGKFEVPPVPELLKALAEQAVKRAEDERAYAQVWLNWSTNFAPAIRERFLVQQTIILDKLTAILNSATDGRMREDRDDARILLAASQMLTVMKLDGVDKARRDRFTEHTIDVVLAYRGDK